MGVRESVLRLHRWRLQERQDYLAGLESLLERLRGDHRRLQDEMGGSARAAEEDGAHPLMVRPLVERQRRIERSVVEIEAQIAEARAAVGEAQQEVKHAEFGIAQTTAATAPRPVRRSRRERTNGHSNTVPPSGGRSRLF